MIKSCSIHCWQHLNDCALFEFNATSVTFTHFLQWVKASFSKLHYSFFAPGFTVRIYYLCDIESWSRRVTLHDDLTLRTYLMQVADDQSLQSYIVVSFEEETPAKPPSYDDMDDVSIISGLTSNSGGTTVEDYFRQRVLARDQCCCVFCGDTVKANLQAAHVYDADIPDDPNFLLEQYGILDFYDTDNGLTLCNQCHKVFDALLCCVRVLSDGIVDKHVIVVADALKAAPKWTQLDGAAVRLPAKELMTRWPPAALFAFREAKFMEKTQKRHEYMKANPNICYICGKRTKTPGRLLSHIGSRTCLKKMSNNSNQF